MLYGELVFSRALHRARWTTRGRRWWTQWWTCWQWLRRHGLEAFARRSPRRIHCASCRSTCSRYWKLYITWFKIHWYIICSILLFLKWILCYYRICFVGLLRDRMRGTYRSTSVSTAWRFVARGLRATCCCECIPRSITSTSSIRLLTRRLSQ